MRKGTYIGGNGQRHQHYRAVQKMLMTKLRQIACLLLVAVQAGCTTVYVSSEDGSQLTVTRNFGLTYINSDINTVGKGSLIYKASGLGLLFTPRGGTLGWVEETTALLADASRCQMIVWLHSAQERKSFEAWMAENKIPANWICTIPK